MNQEEFKNEFAEALREKLYERGNEVEVTINTVEKMNESYEAITVRPEGSNVGVNMNLEVFAEAYESGVPFNEIVDQVAGKVEAHIGNMPEFDEKSVIIVKEIGSQEGYSEMERIAESILDSLGEEKKKDALIAYGTIVGDNLPAYDIVLSSAVESIDVEMNKPVDFSFFVENVAADTIRTIEIECDFGNGRKETKTIEVEIPYLASDSIVFDGVVFEELGVYDVKFTVTKLNGNDDLTPENNVHLVKVNVIERIVKRKVLLEIFSTENCTNCPHLKECCGNKRYRETI